MKMNQKYNFFPRKNSDVDGSWIGLNFNEDSLKKEDCHLQAQFITISAI